MREATRPTVPDVLPLVRVLFKSDHGSNGGCLHIVLDERNVRDENVEFCIGWAVENGCSLCETIGRALLMMSRTQRLKLAALAWAIGNE